MLTGFEKIVEQRIRQAQKNGMFDNLPGSGEPLNPLQEGMVAEDLRLAYKILKNADCLPPEIELKKEINQIKDLLAGMEETGQKYAAMKKLNFLIMKLNMMKNTSIHLDMNQCYSTKLVEHLEKSVNHKK